MEKKIFELTKCNPAEHHCCIICPGTKPATTRVNIQRLMNIRNDSLIVFYVCDECLTRMLNDFKDACKTIQNN